MKILIKKVRITDATSLHHNQLVDILITDGIITSIKPEIRVDADKTIDCEGFEASPGWVDIFAHFADPGLEQKETLETGARAAARGGFTDVMLIPNNVPCTHHKSQVEYFYSKSKNLAANIYPIGAISKNTEGKELAEIYDMHRHGAVAFSDGTSPVQSADFLLKALQYVSAFNGIIIQLPDDKSINPHGQMNEGIMSTQLGLPGKPAIAEELMIHRDIELCKYTGSKIHFTGISTKKAVEIISQAKAAGLPITCSTTPYHLFFTDDNITNYQSNLKINPPLRTKADRDALQNALQNGMIDCITAHHMPHEDDCKIVEFEYAKFGISGIETAYPILVSAMPQIANEQWVNLLCTSPRQIFKLPTIKIEEGAEAALTIFTKDKKSVFTKDNFISKSKNSPVMEMPLDGYVMGTIVGDKINLNNILL